MIVKALIRKYERELARENARLENCKKFDKLLITQKNTTTTKHIY